jgi:hypothetical protein
MNHPFNPLIELFLVADTFAFLYVLALLSRALHRPPPPAAPDAVPARTVTRPEPQPRDDHPYRMDAGVAVSGPEPGRHERVEARR